MIQGLIILSGAVPGFRDLMWVPGAEDTAAVGYHVFRAHNRYGPWTQLTTTPVPGTRYRDVTRLDSQTYTVLSTDWVDRGLKGNYIFRVPQAPLYGDVVAGRVILASRPEDVTVTIDGTPIPVARVDGFDGTIWLAHAYTLRSNGDWRERLSTLPEDTSAVVVTYKTLGNFVDPTPENRAFYTVVPVLPHDVLAHAAGAPGTEIINTLEVDKMNYIQSEMVRRSNYLLECEGEPCHLLIRRTIGPRCGCLPDSPGQGRTGCTSCYETGIIGGYYGPYDFLFLDPDAAATIEVEEQGRKTTRQSRSWCGPTPVLQAGDIIVRKNGERMVIGPPVYKSPKGVLLHQDYDVTLIPAGDTRYRIPLRGNDAPVVFNPAFQESPGVLGEPVVNPLTDPTQRWENTQVPVGRTTVFGNIQT